MRDPYSILGVKRDAGSDEIKAAWRSKAKTVHPDQNRDDPDATARFAEIGQAYDLLKDPRKRGLYDQARRSAENKQREQTIMQKREAAREAAERAKAAEKLMEELARAQQRSAREQAAAGEAGAEEKASAETAEEVLERIFAAEAKVKGGSETDKSAAPSGTDETSIAQDKPEAGSSLALGFFNALIRRIRRTQPAPEKAPDITAEAIVTVQDLVEQKPVTIKMPDDRELRFMLEPGATDGHVMRLKGQGLKLPDAARGDLVVTVLVARDDAFTVRHHDIHTTLPIALADAVLGCETTVQSPRGDQRVTVPAWSGSDKALRVEGKGLPKEDGTFGDLVVELRIVLLDTPDAKVTDLMRHMREGLYL